MDAGECVSSDASGRGAGERARARAEGDEIVRARGGGRPVAIVRRVDRGGADARRGTDGRDHGDVVRVTTTRAVEMSAEAREAAYRLARERIFGDGDGDEEATGEGRRVVDDRGASESVGSGGVGGESSVGGASGGRMSAGAEPFAPSKAVKKGSWRDRKDPEEYQRGTGVYLPRMQQFAAQQFAAQQFAAQQFAAQQFAAQQFAAQQSQRFAAPPYRAPPTLTATAPPVPKGPPPPNQLIRPPSR